MKPAKDARIEASQKFNPYVLCHYLTRADDGIVIVDRSRVIKDKETQRLFDVILNVDYLWEFHNPDRTTIYFDVEGGEIYAGLYQIGFGRYTRKLIATTRCPGMMRRYQYPQETLDKMIDLILDTPYTK